MWGNNISRILSLLVITPLVLTRFTTPEVAIWYLFSSFIVLGALIDFGFSPVIVRLVSYAAAGSKSLQPKKDTIEIDKNVKKEINWEMLEKLYGSINVIYTILSLVLFLLLSTLGSYLVSKQLLLLEDSDYYWSVWTVMCFGLSIGFYGKRYDSLLKGLNYITLVNKWEIVTNLFTGVSLLAVLLLGGGILDLVLCTQIWVVINICIKRIITKRIHGGRISIFIKYYIEKSVLNKIWSPSWRTGIITINSHVLLQFSGIIYSQYANAVELASYLFSLKLMSIANQLSWAPFYSKIPIYSKLRIQNKIDELYRLSCKGLKFSLLVFLFISISIGLSANYVLELIQASTNIVPYMLWLLMVIVWFLDRQSAMHSQIYMTTNKVPFYVTYSVSGAIYILLLFITIETYGMWSPVISMLIANSMINNWWNVSISLKSLNKSFNDYFRHYLSAPLLLLVLYIIIILIINY